MLYKRHPTILELWASEEGKIWSSDKDKFLHESDTASGYLSVWVSSLRKSLLSHRVVSQCFYGDFRSDTPVNHLNGNKKDNCPSNLEKSSISENNKHSRYILGNSSGNSLRKFDDIRILTLATMSEVSHISKIAKSLSIPEGTIRAIVSGNNYANLNYLFSDLGRFVTTHYATPRIVINSGKKSKYGRGVKKKGKKFLARINFQREEIILGSFKTLEEAQQCFQENHSEIRKNVDALEAL